MNITHSHPFLTTLTAAGLLAATSSLAQTPQAERAADTHYEGGARQPHTFVDSEALRRVESLIGKPVRDSTGQSIGEIMDFAIDFNDQPRITHVLVSSEGDDRGRESASVHGEVRAVPIEAITYSGDGARIELPRNVFQRTPALPRADRAAFFDDPARVQEVQRVFNEHSTGTVLQGDWQKLGPDGQPLPATATVPDNSDALPPVLADDDRTRPASEVELEVALDKITDDATTLDALLFTELNEERIHSPEGEVLGTVTGAWLRLDDGSLPLVEIQRQSDDAQITQNEAGSSRFGFPSHRYQGTDEQGRHTFNVQKRDIAEATAVTDMASLNEQLQDGPQVLHLSTDVVKAGNNASHVAE